MCPTASGGQVHPAGGRGNRRDQLAGRQRSFRRSLSWHVPSSPQPRSVLLVAFPFLRGTSIAAKPVHAGAASGVVKWTSLCFVPVAVPPSAVSAFTKAVAFAASVGSFEVGTGLRTW